MKIAIEDCIEQKEDGKCAMCEEGILVRDGACNEDNKCSVKQC